MQRIRDCGVLSSNKDILPFIKPQDHCRRGSWKAVRSRGIGHLQQHSICWTQQQVHGTHKPTEAVARSVQDQTSQIPTWLWKGLMKSSPYVRIYLQSLGDSHFSSGMWPLRGYSCSCRWSYTHAQATLCGFSQLKKKHEKLGDSGSGR